MSKPAYMWMGRRRRKALRLFPPNKSVRVECVGWSCFSSLAETRVSLLYHLADQSSRMRTRMRMRAQLPNAETQTARHTMVLERPVKLDDHPECGCEPRFCAEKEIGLWVARRALCDISRSALYARGKTAHASHTGENKNGKKCLLIKVLFRFCPNGFVSALCVI